MKVAIVSTILLLSGCATQLSTYTPGASQPVTYDQGVGAVMWETNETILTMYPTFRYQSPTDIPTFTLMVQNKTDHDIDFVPESIHAYLDDHEWHVYSLEERVGEIRSSAKRRQIALAVIGGLAAGGAAYNASHQTTTYSGYSQVGSRSYWSGGTIQTYDPAAGMLAGAAVGAATGVGLHQIEKAAGYEEQAAHGIFQHTTIKPGAVIVGQVMLKKVPVQNATLKMEVPITSAPTTFTFTRKTTSS